MWSKKLLKNIPRRISKEAGDDGGGGLFEDPLPSIKSNRLGYLPIFNVNFYDFNKKVTKIGNFIINQRCMTRLNEFKIAILFNFDWAKTYY